MEQRGGQDWSLWDLWFCVIAVRDHGGDLDAFAQDFVDAIRKPGIYGRDGAEAKLSHLHDLQARLADAGLTAGDLADDEVLGDRGIAARAREKVTGRIGLEGRACTSAMIDTPDADSNSVPATAAGRPSLRTPPVLREVPPDPLNASTTSRRARRSPSCRGSPSDSATSTSPAVACRIASRFYRAFHTAGLELADAADDSYGNIGQAHAEAWDTCLGIDWRSTGMDPAAYWQDLCELRIWEPYGLDFKQGDKWFRSARPDDVPIVESILLALEQEHYDAVLDYPAEDALTALADLYVATRSRDRYVMAARRLGSRAWRPIVAMAQAQLNAKDRAGAVAVFKAARPARFSARLLATEVPRAHQRRPGRRGEHMIMRVSGCR